MLLTIAIVCGAAAIISATGFLYLWTNVSGMREVIDEARTMCGTAEDTNDRLNKDFQRLEEKYGQLIKNHNGVVSRLSLAEQNITIIDERFREISAAWRTS